MSGRGKRDGAEWGGGCGRRGGSAAGVRGGAAALLRNSSALHSPQPAASQLAPPAAHAARGLSGGRQPPRGRRRRWLRGQRSGTTGGWGWKTEEGVGRVTPASKSNPSAGVPRTGARPCSPHPRGPPGTTRAGPRSETCQGHSPARPAPPFRAPQPARISQGSAYRPGRKRGQGREVPRGQPAARARAPRGALPEPRVGTSRGARTSRDGRWVSLQAHG